MSRSRPEAPTDSTADPEGSPRWIEIDGQRWRASDPAIPHAFRQELVDELMRARRAIKLLKSSNDPGLVADARRQVHAAKTALGERGEPWWEEPTVEGRRARVEAAILALAGNRAPDSSICPSDAARAVGGSSWRQLVPIAQQVARDLARSGDVVVTQRGNRLDPDEEWRGPIRIRIDRR